MDLLSICEGHKLVVLLCDEARHRSRIVQFDFVGFEAIGNLFRWIDQRIGQLDARQSPRHTREVRTENTPFPTWCHATAMTCITAECFVNDRALAGIAAFQRIGRKKPVNFLVALFGVAARESGDEFLVIRVGVPVFPKFNITLPHIF